MTIVINNNININFSNKTNLGLKDKNRYKNIMKNHLFKYIIIMAKIVYPLYCIKFLCAIRILNQIQMLEKKVLLISIIKNNFFDIKKIFNNI